MSDTSPLGTNIQLLLPEAQYLQSLVIDSRTGLEVMSQPVQDLLYASIQEKVNTAVANNNLVVAFTENENRLLQQTLESIFQGFNNESMVVETEGILDSWTDKNILISIKNKLEIAIEGT